MKKYTGLLFVLLSLLSLLSCSLSASGGKDDDDIRVSSIKYETTKRTIDLGEVTNIRLVLEPAEARKSKTVTYTVDKPGLVQISITSNDGIVVTGIGSGTTVIIASCGGFSDYCEVTVTGNTLNTQPYIIVPSLTYEVAEGTKKSISASIFGGTITDNNNFVWSIEDTNGTVAALDVSGNTAIITGLQSGVVKVSVSHPKAEYSVDILVFVLGTSEKAVYISTEQNIINLKVGNDEGALGVTLVGGAESDKANFVYKVTSGTDVIEITKANDTCVIKQLKAGTAKIQIQHPKATYSLTVLVVVSETVNETYLEVDNSFVLLSGQEGKMITASFIGGVPSTAYADFTYTISNPGCINVTQINNSFYVTGVAAGSTKLVIANKNVAYAREVLIIVQDQDENVTSNENYITTSQNIIQLETGGTPVTLNMTLVGGNEADKNSFSWTVENSAIIGVDTPHGVVTNARSVSAEVFNARAVVTPKSAGTTKIEITHPKTAVGATVIVKVYPKGTYNTSPVVLQSNKSLIKIVKGTTQDHELLIASGSATTLGSVVWATEDAGVATVVGTNLAGTVSGKESGNTTLKVTGDNLYQPYTASVLVGTEAELANTKYIYVDSKYQKLTSKQTTYTQIKSNNDLLEGDNHFAVANTDSGIVYCRMVNDVLIMQGLNAGTAEVTVTNPNATNSITLFVTVEAGDISIDKPYYFTGENFIGVVKGAKKTLSVTLVGAPEVERSKIKWTIENASIATIVGNGSECSITANAIGQTKITASHPKSAESKEFILYTANTEAELASMFVMAAPTSNYMLATGGNLFIKLTSNGSAAQNANIAWAVDDASILSIDDNYDSAYIKGLNPGNAVITVTHPNAVIPLKIYVSVKDSDVSEEGKSIIVPTIVEMVKGDNKVILPAYTGFTETEKQTMTWTIEDTTVASISGTGEKAYVFGKKAGQAYVTVTYPALKYSKRILVLVVNSEEELSSTYVMAVDSAYHTMNKGDEKTVSLIFGSAGFPEYEKSNITWTATANNVIELVGNGTKGTIIAKNEGIAIVTVTHPLITRPVTFKVEVSDPANVIIKNSYSFVVDKMKGIVVGNTIDFTALLYDETHNEVTTGLSSYVTIKHPKVAEDTRVLIFTAATAADLANMYPLATEKENYLIDIGETVDLKINTLDSNATQLGKIKWSIESTSFINYSTTSKTEMKITGKKAGNTKITVTHENASQPVVFYISIKDPASDDATKKIVTESIIGVVKGESRLTSVQTNLTSSESVSLQWASENTAVATVTGSGTDATIKAIGVGETYVTVSYAGLKRKILVYVCATQNEVNNYCAMNIDKQYYKIGKNDQLTLNVYYAPNIPASVNATTSQD